MAKIRWTREAENWLREIYNHIAQDNPGAAERVVTGIYGKAQVLADFPEIGHKYRTEPEGEIRILLYGHYRIAYLIKGRDQEWLFTLIARPSLSILHLSGSARECQQFHAIPGQGWKGASGICLQSRILRVLPVPREVYRPLTG